MSVDALPWSAGTVSPLANALSLEPSWRSRYFRPSAERGRMRNVESRGMSPMRLSSLRASSATTLPSGWRTGRASSITPTRLPPERISLPGTRLAPLGTRTFSCVVGTNGRPWLAL